MEFYIYILKFRLCLFRVKCFLHFLIFGAGKKFWSTENDFRDNSKFAIVGKYVLCLLRGISHFLDLVSPSLPYPPLREPLHHPTCRGTQQPPPPSTNPFCLSLAIPPTLVPFLSVSFGISPTLSQPFSLC